MKKRLFFILTALVLTVLCGVYVVIRGQTYTLRFNAGDVTDADACSVRIGDDAQAVELTEKRIEDGKLLLTFRSKARGKAFVAVTRPGDMTEGTMLYSHASGVITRETVFGECTGGRIIPAAITVYLLLMFVSLVLRYRREMRENLYRYGNIMNLALLIILFFMVIHQAVDCIDYRGMLDTVQSTLTAAASFSMIALPVAFVLSVFVTASSMRLLRREGRSVRNMLACALGVVFCFCTLFPFALGEYLQHYSTVIDVHNQNGIALYVELAVENIMLVVVAYLECILIATIALSLKAARRIPAPDKDYILILGCQIKKDGTLTPLLRGRADRALEFAAMQKEKTGKPIIFVPSGGQGADEVRAEGDAIRDYLLSRGVGEAEILTENRSTSTEENFRFSLERIRETAPQTDPKIAFSTTNYHVFRAGMLASKEGIRAEGIGSRTRRYFWINAFVREFIATLHMQRKRHLYVLLPLVLITLSMVVFVYIANNM